MAASLSVPFVDAAPGNQVKINGSGLTGGSNASVTLGSQGVNAPPGLAPTTITIPATFAVDGSSVTIAIPDGVMNGTLTVTANDNTMVTCALRARSQYVQAFEYMGEGEDTSSLAPGELDIILRRASDSVDAAMGESVRLLQKIETPRYRSPKNGPPQIRPYRCRGRRCPIVSVDQLAFISASDLITLFNSNDLYVNDNLGYIEILAYAIGNFALLGMLQTIGYSANVLRLAYTSGYRVAEYPSEVCTATIITATHYLNRRRRQRMAMGAFSKFEDQLTVDQAAMQVPLEARRLLRPYTVCAIA